MDQQVVEKFKAIAREKRPSRIVTIGDTVTKSLVRSGIAIQLAVTDNRSMRKRIRPVKYPADTVLHAENPAGKITEEAITKIREALTMPGRVQVMIDGEEDLLALVAVLYAPEKSLVVYGQPNEGMVVVEVTEEKKTETCKFLEAMKVRKPK